MIPREILKKIRQIELRTNRIGLVRVEQATGLCRPAARRTERQRVVIAKRLSDFFELSTTLVRRVAERNGRVARSTLNFSSHWPAFP